MNPSEGDLAPTNPDTPPTSPTRRRFGTETQEPVSSASRAGEGEIDSEGSEHGNTGDLHGANTTAKLCVGRLIWRDFCDKVNKAYDEAVQWR